MTVTTFNVCKGVIFKNDLFAIKVGMTFTFKSAKKKFMANDTVEGEQLVREIAPFILKKFNSKKIPLMFRMIRAILKNKKFLI